MPLSMAEREAILGDVIDEVFGLGPLEPLLRDPSVSDILVNGLQAGLRRAQRQARTLPTTFQDDKHLMRIIDRIVAASAAASTKLADGRRPPAGRLARQRDHPAARARRPAALDPPLSAEPLKAEDLVAIRTLTQADARVPRALRPRAG